MDILKIKVQIVFWHLKEGCHVTQKLLTIFTVKIVVIPLETLFSEDEQELIGMNAEQSVKGRLI